MEERRRGPFVLPPQASRLPMRIRGMHTTYGVTEGERCGTCRHLYSKHYDRRYYKCDLNRDTNGPATDWRVSWQACGKWEAREEAGR
jgi:hypothetical protein